jgi:hypothetical protein
LHARSSGREGPDRKYLLESSSTLPKVRTLFAQWYNAHTCIGAFYLTLAESPTEHGGGGVRTTRDSAVGGGGGESGWEDAFATIISRISGQGERYMKVTFCQIKSMDAWNGLSRRVDASVTLPLPLRPREWKWVANNVWCWLACLQGPCELMTASCTVHLLTELSNRPFWEKRELGGCWGDNNNNNWGAGGDPLSGTHHPRHPRPKKLASILEIL